MSLDEEALETAAKGGMMDFEKWPAMVEPLLERLEYIVYNVFPMPEMRPQAPRPLSNFYQPSSYPSSQLHDPNSIPSSSNKENAYPTDLDTPPRPTVPSAPATSASTERVPDSQPESFSAPPSDSLPAPLMLLLNSIRSTMRSYFTSKPPHTIQRLAELILRPNSHYRTLPAYLRAVDRVVSVTSSADIFPSQMHASANQPNGLLNGVSGGFDISNHVHGSDESLGGALLTPIPWLSNAASFEDDAAASLEQGLVPEHEAASTMPSDHHQQPHPQEVETPAAQPSVVHDHSTTTATTAEAETPVEPTSPPPDASDAVPHARGPPVVGVEDMGLQDGKGVEMPLANVEGDSGEQTAAQNGQQTKPEGADHDGDIVLGDVKNEGARQEQRSAEDTSKGTEQETENKD